MITIAQIVDDIISRKPLLEELLSENLVNLSALARNIQAEIEQKLGKDINHSAILMALKGYTSKLDLSINIKLKKTISQLGEITVRSMLSDYTFRNSDKMAGKQQELLKLISEERDCFYTFSQGIYETTIIISSAYKDALEKVFESESLVAKKDDLSSVTLKLPADNFELAGLYYFILKKLAWENINIIEVISTTNEFTVIVEESKAAQTFNALKSLNN